jgi:hypothetical protein
VQRAFAEFFGGDPSFDIFTQTLTGRSFGGDVTDDIPNTEPGGYRWSHNDPIYGFGFYTRVDKETQTLQGIEFAYNTNGFYEVHSAKQIIQDFGPSSAIYGGQGSAAPQQF